MLSRLLPQPLGTAIDYLELLGRLRIKHQNIRLEGIFDFIDFFPYSGINNLAGVNPRLKGSIQLPSGDYIYAASLSNKNPEHGNI